MVGNPWVGLKIFDPFRTLLEIIRYVASLTRQLNLEVGIIILIY